MQVGETLIIEAAIAKSERKMGKLCQQGWIQNYASKHGLNPDCADLGDDG